MRNTILVQESPVRYPNKVSTLDEQKTLSEFKILKSEYENDDGYERRDEDS